MPNQNHRYEYEALRLLLRQMRLELDLTQLDLAKLLNKPRYYVSRYEIGERRLDLIEVRHICQAMGVPLKNFLNRLEKRLKDTLE